MLWWALAAGLDQIGRWLAHPIPGRRRQSENVAFDADHMLERCRLFLLIALGETVFTTGTAIAAAPATLMSLVTGTFALAGTVALWALSFGRSHRLIIRHLEQTHDPIRTSRHTVNALMVMVAGLIAVAVANEMVIAHPYGVSSFAKPALGRGTDTLSGRPGLVFVGSAEHSVATAFDRCGRTTACWACDVSCTTVCCIDSCWCKSHDTRDT